MNLGTIATERAPVEIRYHTEGSLIAESRMFESSYIGIDPARNSKIVWEGMILAINTTTSKYVPYNAAASYGAGSDTAAGVLGQRYDVSLGDVPVAPYYQAFLKEERCYVFGGAMGTVPGAVKTTLARCRWL